MVDETGENSVGRTEQWLIDLAKTLTQELNYTQYSQYSLRIELPERGWCHIQDNKSDIGYIKVVAEKFGIWLITQTENHYLSLADPSLTEQLNQHLLNLKQRATVQTPQAKE